jgi:hypothetical protein
MPSVARTRESPVLVRDQLDEGSRGVDEADVRVDAGDGQPRAIGAEANRRDGRAEPFNGADPPSRRAVQQLQRAVASADGERAPVG